MRTTKRCEGCPALIDTKSRFCRSCQSNAINQAVIEKENEWMLRAANEVLKAAH